MQNDYSKLPKEELNALRALLYNQRARPAPATGGLEANQLAGVKGKQCKPLNLSLNWRRYMT